MPLRETICGLPGALSVIGSRCTPQSAGSLEGSITRVPLVLDDWPALRPDLDRFLRVERVAPFEAMQSALMRAGGARRRTRRLARTSALLVRYPGQSVPPPLVATRRNTVTRLNASCPDGFV